MRGQKNKKCQSVKPIISVTILSKKSLYNSKISSQTNHQISSINIQKYPTSKNIYQRSKSQKSEQLKQNSQANNFEKQTNKNIKNVYNSNKVGQKEKYKDKENLTHGICLSETKKINLFNTEVEQKDGKICQLRQNINIVNYTSSNQKQRKKLKLDRKENVNLSSSKSNKQNNLTNRKQKNKTPISFVSIENSNTKPKTNSDQCCLNQQISTLTSENKKLKNNILQMSTQIQLLKSQKLGFIKQIDDERQKNIVFQHLIEEHKTQSRSKTIQIVRSQEMEKYMNILEQKEKQQQKMMQIISNFQTKLNNYINENYGLNNKVQQLINQKQILRYKNMNMQEQIKVLEQRYNKRFNAHCQIQLQKIQQQLDCLKHEKVELIESYELKIMKLQNDIDEFKQGNNRKNGEAYKYESNNQLSKLLKEQLQKTEKLKQIQKQQKQQIFKFKEFQVNLKQQLLKLKQLFTLQQFVNKEEFAIVHSKINNYMS